MRHAGRGVIRLGDKTDHGGVVTEVSSDTIAMGLEAALVGDLTACPKCKGTFQIVRGSEGALHIGRQYAYDGDKTACGARLISTV
ncbi:PAAR domain-containing protein [Pseudoduganella sp. GCM10020061]|uniref:PAAR domain-containing protein n=1 Tax=Pseudoduganella sp. GCM10020061 TaxID=3317345 RepID=UPI00364184AB